jgi:hypothetical protein
VLNFTLVLREELRGTGVRASVLCPGGIRTNEEVRARIDSLWPLGRWSCREPEVVAAYTLRRLARGRAVIVPGALNRATRFLGRWRAPEVELKGCVPADFRLPDFRGLTRCHATRDGLLKYYPGIRHLLYVRPVIDEPLCRRCIRCWCCQESCPHPEPMSRRAVAGGRPRFTPVRGLAGATQKGIDKKRSQSLLRVVDFIAL